MENARMGRMNGILNSQFYILNSQLLIEMAVTIKADFSMAWAQGLVREHAERAKARTLDALGGLAARMHAHLRGNAEFYNHTHDLRSSLCALVFRDGRVHRAFHAQHGPGARGLERGMAVARDNIPPDGAGIMLVAGMGYAAYVEARENKWVISGTSAELKRILEKWTMDNGR